LVGPPFIPTIQMIRVSIPILPSSKIKLALIASFISIVSFSIHTPFSERLGRRHIFWSLGLQPLSCVGSTSLCYLPRPLSALPLLKIRKNPDIVGKTTLKDQGSSIQHLFVFQVSAGKTCKKRADLSLHNHFACLPIKAL